MGIGLVLGLLEASTLLECIFGFGYLTGKSETAVPLFLAAFAYTVPQGTARLEIMKVEY